MKNNTGSRLFNGIETITFLIVAIIEGWLLTVLWGWFVVPTFGLPELTIPVAMGLSIIVNMFQTHHLNEQLTFEQRIKRILVALILPFITLLFAWVVHLFV